MLKNISFEQCELQGRHSFRFGEEASQSSRKCRECKFTMDILQTKML